MTNRRRLALVAGMSLLFGTGCACLYGACGAGSRSTRLTYDGETCTGLESGVGEEHELGYGDAKQHRMGDGQRYFVVCFGFTGKKGMALTIQVESDEFQPDIYLQKKGTTETLAHDNGSSRATMSTTIPSNAVYAVLVTSVDPLERGTFTIGYRVD